MSSRRNFFQTRSFLLYLRKLAFKQTFDEVGWQRRYASGGAMKTEDNDDEAGKTWKHW